MGDILHGGQQPAEQATAIEKMIRSQAERLAARERGEGEREQLSAKEQLEKWAEARMVKIKTTYYLNYDAYKNLEDARQTIADMMPEAARYRVTRSLLVELAIKLVLRDFEKRGKDGAFFRSVLRELRRDPRR